MLISTGEGFGTVNCARGDVPTKKAVDGWMRGTECVASETYKLGI